MREGPPVLKAFNSEWLRILKVFSLLVAELQGYLPEPRGLLVRPLGRQFLGQNKVLGDICADFFTYLSLLVKRCFEIVGMVPSRVIGSLSTEGVLLSGHNMWGQKWHLCLQLPDQLEYGRRGVVKVVT